ncbi:F0F1 ATP synthase subunit A [bacterium]|nr:F0F1 ATP synthase subunit A [bacterium]
MKTYLSLVIVLIITLISVPQTLSAEEQGHEAHSEQAAEQNKEHDGHGGDESLGGTLVGILEHHLLDSQHLDLFGLSIHLPTIQIGSFEYRLTVHRVWWVFAMMIVFILAIIAARQKSEVPTGLRNMFEALILFVRDEVVKPNLGSMTDKFMPYFLTLFTAILFSNLLGLMPWGVTSTGNVNVTAGLALCTLAMMIGMGVKENGVGGFLSQFSPPGVPGWLLPILIPIEIVSFFIRPFALTIRLFANMLAGHAVYFVLLGLILSLAFAVPALAVAAGVFILEIVVSLIQAYIFIMLTAVFTGLTMHPAH